MSVTKYGQEFPDSFGELEIELYCFKYRLREDQGGLGAFNHFWNVVEICWNYPESNQRVNKTPWLEKMVQAALDNDEVAIAGCSSSGKSFAMGLFAIVSWMSSPQDTLVLITSTSLKEAKLRIWKTIESLWYARPGLPGKYRRSEGVICYQDPLTGEVHEGTGLSLVAAAVGNEEAASKKLIGIKAKHLMLIADELSELSPAIAEACRANLKSNPNFRIVGMSNPHKRLDPFGLLATPKIGWAEVNDTMYSWETKNGGIFLRLDATESPNVVAGEVVYFGLPTLEYVEGMKNDFGEDSVNFARFIRAVFPTLDMEDVVYPEHEITDNGCLDAVIWKESPVKYAALDPAFTSGGDRSSYTILSKGIDIRGLEVIAVESEGNLDSDVRSKVSESYQVAKLYRELCQKESIPPERAAYDSTGAGLVFGEILAVEWSPKVVPICFSGGAPSEDNSTTVSNIPSKLTYYNRMSEIWFGAKKFVRSGHIRGFSEELAKEMTGRAYETIQGNKIQVEPKKLYKKRLGRSPDKADSFLLGFDLIKNFKDPMMAKEEKAVSVVSNDDYLKRAVKLNDAIYGDLEYSF